MVACFQAKFWWCWVAFSVLPLFEQKALLGRILLFPSHPTLSEVSPLDRGGRDPRELGLNGGREFNRSPGVGKGSESFYFLGTFDEKLRWQEFLLWHSRGLCSIHSCGIGCSCSLDLILCLETSVCHEHGQKKRGDKVAFPQLPYPLLANLYITKPIFLSFLRMRMRGPPQLRDAASTCVIHPSPPGLCPGDHPLAPLFHPLSAVVPSPRGMTVLKFISSSSPLSSIHFLLVSVSHLTLLTSLSQKWQ